MYIVVHCQPFFTSPEIGFEAFVERIEKPQKRYFLRAGTLMPLPPPPHTSL